MYETTFEIWDMYTNKVLADNLTFEQAEKLSVIYQDFFGDTMDIAFRESYVVNQYDTKAQVYKSAWIEYFGMLQEMGNLL